MFSGMIGGRGGRILVRGASAAVLGGSDLSRKRPHPGVLEVVSHLVFWEDVAGGPCVLGGGGGCRVGCTCVSVEEWV